MNESQLTDTIESTNTDDCGSGPANVIPASQSLQNLTKESLPISPGFAISNGDASVLRIRGSDLASYAPPRSGADLSRSELNLLLSWAVNEVATMEKKDGRAIIAAVSEVVRFNTPKEPERGDQGKDGDALAHAVRAAAAARLLELNSPLPPDREER